MRTHPGTPIRLVLLVLVALIMALVVVEGVLAATPNDVQYNKTRSGNVVSAVKGKQKGGTLGTTKTTGTLPFTGLDLGIVSGGAALVLIGGVALRRLGRKNRPGA